MGLAIQDSLNPGVRRRELLGWAMYDFANSGYTTVVMTAVFNAYFVSVVAQGQPWATLAWTLVLAVSNALVMLVLPVLGAYADIRAAKKRCLAWATGVCVLFTLMMAGAGQGDLAWAAVAVILSNLAYSCGEALIAAFLPELAKRDALGRVSGWGWGFGYFGGMVALGLSLAYVLWAQGQQLPATHYVPVSLLITAGVYALASLATFALLRERARPQALPSGGLMGVVDASFARLHSTWRESRRYRDFSWLLSCAVFYQAGIAVVIALAAVYATQVLGFSQVDNMVLVFLVNIAAALGALAFGHVQDRLGHRRSLAITLWGWVLMTVVAYVATTKPVFWVAAVLAGLCMGSAQAAGRALAGVLAPTAQLAEFYGLWFFATRAAAIVGPLTYGLVTWLTGGNHRLGIVATGVFFLVGLALLAKVDVERGEQAARLGDVGAMSK